MSDSMDFDGTGQKSGWGIYLTNEQEYYLSGYVNNMILRYNEAAEQASHDPSGALRALQELAGAVEQAGAVVTNFSENLTKLYDSLNRAADF